MGDQYASEATLNDTEPNAKISDWLELCMPEMVITGLPFKSEICAWNTRYNYITAAHARWNWHHAGFVHSTLTSTVIRLA